jgi:hypothetical protein
MKNKRDNVRRIRADDNSTWLQVEGQVAKLHVCTEKGARAEITMRLDSSAARCAIRQLTSLVAREIKEELRKHASIKAEAGDLYHEVANEVKGGQ